MSKSIITNNQEEKPKKSKSILRTKLFASEMLHRRLFESAKDGFLILDAESGKIVDVNPFLTELLGYSKNEFIEKTIWEIGFFKDIYQSKEKFHELQQEEYVQYDELPLLTSEGRKIYVEFVSNVYLVENQRIIQCSIRDITARKEMEAVLEKTGKELAEIKKSADEINEFNENIIDTIREPLLLIDKDLRVIKASRSFYNFFKVTVEETIGKLIYELGNYQWDIPKLKELLEKIIPEKNSFDNYEVEHNFSAIGKRVMLLNARQVKRAFGKEQIILLTVEDITERKSKEDSLEKTHRATSEFLNILLNLMHAPIIIWDTSMIIIRFNRQFELLSGYDSADVIGRKIDFLFPKEKINSTLELLKNNLDAEHLEVTEIDILTKDNNIKRVLWNSSRILDEEGKNIIATISQDITNRRQSELALRKSESHLRTLVRTIPDLIWLKDTNGVFLSCNPMFERFFGAKENDIIGKTDYDFVDRELANFFRENDKKAIEADKPTSNEEWVTFADDGHRAFLDTIKTPIYDSDGTLLGILGIGRDITERKLADQVLQTSEKRFRAIFDQAPIAISLLDFQGHPIVSNLSLSKMLGYTKDELSKMKFTEFTYPEDIDKDLNQFTDLIAGNITRYNMEKRYIHKNGNLIWANLYVTALKDSNGLPQEIIGMVEDITEQKNNEKELLTLSRAVEQNPSSVIVTDLNGNIEYVNSKTLEITGYTKEELIGKNPRIFSSGEKPKSEYQQLWKTISSANEWFGEFHNKKKNGELYWEFASISPIQNEKQELINYVAIKEDITERKKFIKDLKIAKEKAEESDRLKSAFLANMSHEIRTPMNGILGFTELLLEPDLSSEQKESYINIVNQSGQRMLNTVNDIVEISKIEAGVVTIDLKEVDIQERLIELIRFFIPEAMKKGLKLTLVNEVPKAVAVISTDQNKLDSVFTNLIKNAIKYTGSGTIQLGYETVETNCNESLRFYVKDTGIGIPKHRHEAIFNRFMQADVTDTRKFEGSGLGLAIAKSYVEMLGGKIWVESREGRGSTFYFTLPLANYTKEKSVFLNEIPVDIDNIKVKSKTRRLQILIAEDDKPSRNYISIIVNDLNAETLEAGTGIETVELCRNTKHLDLILMDIQMPEMNGYEATRRIREFNKDVVIIAQTAFALSGDREKALEAGCNDYISKPIKRMELINVIKKYFGY